MAETQRPNPENRKEQSFDDWLDEAVEKGGGWARKLIEDEFETVNPAQSVPGDRPTPAKEDIRRKQFGKLEDI